MIQDTRFSFSYTLNSFLNVQKACWLTKQKHELHLNSCRSARFQTSVDSQLEVELSESVELLKLETFIPFGIKSKSLSRRLMLCSELSESESVELSKLETFISFGSVLQPSKSEELSESELAFFLVVFPL